MNKNIQLNLNINKDDPTLNDYMFCWSVFNKRPNKILIYNTYVMSSFNGVISSMIKDKNTLTEIIPSIEECFINDRILAKISDTIYLSYVNVDRTSEKSTVSDICFYHESDNDLDEINDIITNLNSCILDFCEEDTYRMSTLSIGPNGLEIDPIDIPKSKKIDKFYNKKTFCDIDLLVKSINEKPKGISILYGDRGTGKTSIINYLSGVIDRMFIFIPNNMIDSTINNPEFKRFIRKYPNLLVVIDDCEMMFNEVYTKSNILVNNMMQLVDGYLSDSIGLQIISIFNTEYDKIDHVLLECNNLIGCVEFKNLTKDEANKLAKKKIYDSSTKLSDVLNKKKTICEIEMGL